MVLVDEESLEDAKRNFRILERVNDNLEKENRLLFEKVFWLCWIVVALGVGVLTVVVMWFNSIPDINFSDSLTFLLVFFCVIPPVMFALMEGIVLALSMEDVF